MAHHLPTGTRRNTSIEREREDETSPGRALAVEDEAAAVPDRDVAGDGQPEARPAGVGRPGVVEPGEPLEHRLARLRGDPRSVVGHGQDGDAVPLPQLDRNPVTG